MPQFLWYAVKSLRQAERSPGFVAGRVMRETRNAFWTLTAWEGDAAMNAYRTQGAHRDAMPKLLDWCDEASVVHWLQESRELPSWQEAHRRLMQEGRPSKVKYPSTAHLAHEIPTPHGAGLESVMTAASRSVQRKSV
jgi:hypothetical protein